jgi:hypothetical protein
MRLPENDHTDVIRGTKDGGGHWLRSLQVQASLARQATAAPIEPSSSPEIV